MKRADVLRGRGGFSFIEVMFAVILLGIGFIMIAAIFPVGIRQQQETLDADTAGAMANAAHAAVVASQYTTFSTVDSNVNYDYTALQPIAGSLINSADPRFAWTAVWQWKSAPGVAPYVPGTVLEVTYFILKSRNQERYFPAMIANTIQPVSVDVAKLDYNELGSTITFDAAGAGDDIAEEGAFVVIATSTVITSIGKVYRLSDRETAGNDAIWNLSSDFTPGSPAEVLPAPGPHTAYMVGKGLTDPYSPAAAYAGPTPPGPYSGPAQDVAVVQKRFVVPTP